VFSEAIVVITLKQMDQVMDDLRFTSAGISHRNRYLSRILQLLGLDQ